MRSVSVLKQIGRLFSIKWQRCHLTWEKEYYLSSFYTILQEIWHRRMVSLITVDKCCLFFNKEDDKGQKEYFMTNRFLYLVCYDVSSTTRLYRVHKCIKAFSIGGQKSFYECWMTHTERVSLENALFSLIDESEDRVHFFQLDPRLEPFFLGVAKRQMISPFLIV